jgi:chemotaxis protein CheX
MTNSSFAPFSKATCEVFKLLLDLDVSADAPQTLMAVVDAEDKVNIVIGITGDLSGQILYRFPKETTLEMVRIMSGMEIGEIDDFVTSALGEIANIISGNAMTGLFEQKVVCDILPPRVVVGGDDPMSKSAMVLHTKITTPIGDVELHLQLS